VRHFGDIREHHDPDLDPRYVEVWSLAELQSAFTRTGMSRSTVNTGDQLQNDNLNFGNHFGSVQASSDLAQPTRPMDPREAAAYLHLDDKTITRWAR
jgi:hypothetical protein